MQKTLSVINLNAVRRNALAAKARSSGAKFYAVVKADAYGHGAEQVARYIEDIADAFCVAIIEEGIALRIAGITKPILVFAPPLDSYDVARARAYNLTVTVNCVQTAKLVNGLDCHIKVNTGMNRIGCNPDELPEVLKSIPPESIRGVYSHLFAAQDLAASEKQRTFFTVAERLVKNVNPRAAAHLSASGGILRGGKYLFDGVRCGLLLYGYAPEGFRGGGFEPALKVYARRSQTTRFIGGGIGYNYADRNYSLLSSYRCGYADGFFRNVPLGEKTLCMDAFVARGGGELMCVMDNAQTYAKRAGTIPYEILVNATHRSERIYER